MNAYHPNRYTLYVLFEVYLLVNMRYLIYVDTPMMWFQLTTFLIKLMFLNFILSDRMYMKKNVEEL